MGSEGYRFWTQWLLGAGPVQAGDGRSVVAAAARPLCANLWRRVRGFWQLSGNFYQWSFRLKFIWATYFIWYDRDWIVKGINMPKLGIYSKRELIEKVINDFGIFRNRFFGILVVSPIYWTGTLNVNNSFNVQIWSVSFWAIAGVLCKFISIVIPRSSAAVGTNRSIYF